METGPGPQVCAFLFQLITAVQFFFALAINSMSLMMDCISMEIDVVTYLGNLYAEVKRQSHELSDLDKAKISLVFSGISIGILTGMTTYGLIDVISTLAGGRIKDDLHPAWYLIIFGGFGFLFDLICMYCFSIWGDPEEMGLGAKGAPAAADVEGGAPGAPDTMQPKMSKVRSEAVHGTEVAEKKASAMNMCGPRLGVGNGGRGDGVLVITRESTAVSRRVRSTQARSRTSWPTRSAR